MLILTLCRSSSGRAHCLTSVADTDTCESKKRAVLQRLSNPFKAARYHSLVIEKESCPEVLEVTAWTEDGTIMGVQHKDLNHIQVFFIPSGTLLYAAY